MLMRKYCSGLWKPKNKFEESKFLKIHCKNNTGKLSEMYVKSIFENKRCKYVVQPRIYINSNNYIMPDFYLPEKNLFIEVKSRSYYCNGTASEKVDHIPRKFSKILELEEYKKSKILVIFCAGELKTPATLDLINHKKNKNLYIKHFINLSKKFNVVDWIDVKHLGKYI